jgi:epoxyqueuosine reductase QueG
VSAEIDLLTIRDRLMESATHAGCNAVGVCNQEGLEGGPPSTDLTRQLEGARSAIVISYPVDEEKLELYMGKIDHNPYQEDYIRTNNIIQGLMGEMTNQLRKFGYEASVVYAGNTPGDGTRDDVMPRNERQRKAAELHPAKESDLMVGSIPLISQRMLAAAAGVGFFGMSGNILTMTHGAAVSLGALVTNADLPPTPVLPPEANYCDECNWCGKVCPTSFMSETDFTKVKMGEHDHHKYSTRGHHLRCGSHMMGLTGLSENGKFSSWGPSRKQLPEDESQIFPKLMELGGDLAKRPTVPGGFYDPQKGTRTNIMCSACNLVCHPEKKVRAKRLKMWTQGGVSIQREDGTVETMPLDEARAYLDAMPIEKRALYEDIAEPRSDD